jgi:hypothetical protein
MILIQYVQEQEKKASFESFMFFLFKENFIVKVKTKFWCMLPKDWKLQWKGEKNTKMIHSIRRS